MNPEHFILYIVVFLYGIVIGSFLNVCIYRIPKGENLVSVGSHCMECGHRLKWYDLVPLFSWLFLKGKCRYCGTAISAQYPVVEGLNGLLYVLVFWVNGLNWDSALYCIMVSALFVISVIDCRTMLIPTGADIVVLAVGIVHLVLHLEQWYYYVIGFVGVGLFLLLIAVIFKSVTGRSGLGYGDIELMACAGLCIGWGHGLFALVIGSVLGSLIEGVRMVVMKKRGKFAFGPYLAIGITIAALWGDMFFDWYFQIMR